MVNTPPLSTVPSTICTPPLETQESAERAYLGATSAMQTMLLADDRDLCSSESEAEKGFTGRWRRVGSRGGCQEGCVGEQRSEGKVVKTSRQEDAGFGQTVGQGYYHDEERKEGGIAGRGRKGNIGVSTGTKGPGDCSNQRNEEAGINLGITTREPVPEAAGIRCTQSIAKEENKVPPEDIWSKLLEHPHWFEAQADICVDEIANYANCRSYTEVAVCDVVDSDGDILLRVGSTYFLYIGLQNSCYVVGMLGEEEQVLQKMLAHAGDKQLDIGRHKMVKVCNLKDYDEEQ